LNTITTKKIGSRTESHAVIFGLHANQFGIGTVFGVVKLA